MDRIVYAPKFAMPTPPLERNRCSDSAAASSLFLVVRRVKGPRQQCPAAVVTSSVRSVCTGVQHGLRSKEGLAETCCRSNGHTSVLAFMDTHPYWLSWSGFTS